MTQLEAAKRELLSHYCELCAVSDDWKRQAWRSANDLAAEFPAALGDLPELLTTEMNKRKEGTCPPTTTNGTSTQQPSCAS